jgi:hypothetical protein
MNEIFDEKFYPFNFVDGLKILRFKVTSALIAVRRTRILPINQHAQWPITFGMKGSNGPVASLTALFQGKQCGSCLLSLFMICQQQAAVINSINHFFSFTVSEQCGTSWCSIL